MKDENDVSNIVNENNLNNNGNQESKKYNKVGLIIIIILLILCVGLGGFIFINKDKLFTSDNKLEETKEEQKDENIEQKEENILEVTNEVKTKLERFVRAASVDDNAVSDLTTAKYFNKGTTELTKMIKLKMAYNDLYVYGNPIKTTISKDEYDKMTTQFENKESNYSAEESFTIIKISDFDNAYKTFFNEEPDYTFKEIEFLGCPSPWGMNKELDKFYLFHRCGGVSESSYEPKITSYDTDGKFYLVHQQVKSAYGKEVDNFNLLWKFDKDLNFVSTERE